MNTGILPCNNPHDVGMLFMMLKIHNLDSYFILHNPSSKKHFPAPCTLYDVFVKYLDITTPPTPAMMLLFSQYAADEDEQDRVWFLLLLLLLF